MQKVVFNVIVGLLYLGYFVLKMQPPTCKYSEHHMYEF